MSLFLHMEKSTIECIYVWSVPRSANIRIHSTLTDVFAYFSISYGAIHYIYFCGI